MLYRDTDTGFQPWLGEVLPDPETGNPIKLGGPPANLAAWHLYEPIPADEVPAGKRVVSTHVERVAAEVRYVNVLEDIPPPSSDDIAAEVERRIALPLEIAGLSTGTITINMDAPSQRNLQGLATVGMYLASADPTHITAFRDYSNTSHDLLPSDLVAMGLQVAARIQAVYAASWALKAMSPVPADYTDDGYWS